MQTGVWRAGYVKNMTEKVASGTHLNGIKQIYEDDSSTTIQQSSHFPITQTNINGSHYPNETCYLH